MNVLGLSGGCYHGSADAATALFVDGRCVGAVEEERVSRVKHAPSTMSTASIAECLAIGRVNLSDVDVIAYYVSAHAEGEPGWTRWCSGTSWCKRAQGRVRRGNSG